MALHRKKLRCPVGDGAPLGRPVLEQCTQSAKVEHKPYHVTQLVHASELRMGRRWTKNLEILLPVELRPGVSPPPGCMLDSWNPSPLKLAAPHHQAKYWWASGPWRKGKMTRGYPRWGSWYPREHHGESAGIPQFSWHNSSPFGTISA